MVQYIPLDCRCPQSRPKPYSWREILSAQFHSDGLLQLLSGSRCTCPCVLLVCPHALNIIFERRKKEEEDQEQHSTKQWQIVDDQTQKQAENKCWKCGIVNCPGTYGRPWEALPKVCPDFTRFEAKISTFPCPELPYLRGFLFCNYQISGKKPLRHWEVKTWYSTIPLDCRYPQSRPVIHDLERDLVECGSTLMAHYQLLSASRLLLACISGTSPHAFNIII
jgi:hypothetical protein